MNIWSILALLVVMALIVTVKLTVPKPGQRALIFALMLALLLLLAASLP